MAELFLSGRMVDGILLLMLAEGGILWVWNSRTGRGIAPRDLAAMLFAGACLLCALRAALTAAGWEWIAAWLTAALAAHLLDLARRWRA